LVPALSQPRVRDIDLAARLGFELHRDIRKLVRRHMDELLRYGEVSRHRGTKPPPGSLGGRPEEGYLLNEEQALLICMFSRTERAADVRAQVIAVYLAWRRREFERAALHRVRPPKRHGSGHTAARDPGRSPPSS